MAKDFIKPEKFSQPPMIILLDFLFVLLFVMASKPSHTVTIDLASNDKLFDGATIIYQKDDALFDINNNMITLNEHLNYLIPCENSLYCPKDSYILLPDSLYSDISKLTLSGFDEDVDCSSIKFTISENGKLDKERLLKDNTCFKKIKNFLDNF